MVNVWDVPSMVILTSGKAQSGKDTLALILTERFGFTRVAFADDLKRIAREIFGWNGVKDEAGRRLLQEIGQCAVKYNKFFWCERAEPKIATLPGKPVVISDCRYPHELDWGEKFNCPVYQVRMTGRGGLTGDEALHSSEVALDDYKDWDAVFDNSGTIETLQNTVAEFIFATSL